MLAVSNLAQIWSQLGDALAYLLPVIAITVVVWIVCYAAFVVVFPKWLTSRIVRGDDGTAAIVQSEVDKDPLNLTSYLAWPAYVFMTSLLGSVMGLLLGIIGAFSAPSTEAGQNSLLGAVLSVVVVVMTAAATLFGQNDKIGLRRPLGAISFLLCMVTTGLYWGFVRAQAGA